MDKKLTRDQCYELDAQYNQTPEHPDAVHYETKVFRGST